MDKMILLILLYVLVCWLWKKNIPDGYGKINNLVLFVSSIIVATGCITPLNFVYTFLIACVMLLIDCVAMKIWVKNRK